MGVAKGLFHINENGLSFDFSSKFSKNIFEKPISQNFAQKSVIPFSQIEVFRRHHVLQDPVNWIDPSGNFARPGSDPDPKRTNTGDSTANEIYRHLRCLVSPSTCRHDYDKKWQNDNGSDRLKHRVDGGGVRGCSDTPLIF